MVASSEPINPDFIRLGVNIDHVATLRNARGGIHPDPVDGARLAIEAGADGITAHLREDRRHINDDDITRLQDLCLELDKPLNFEMAAVDEMAEIALAAKPHAVCLVPEKRTERTTEGGLNAAGLHNQITPIARALANNGSRVSLFIEAVPHQISASKACGAQVVEFHTGAYAHALDIGDTEKAQTLLEAMRTGAQQADKLGLEVHYGHGLTFDNVTPVAAIPEAKELNIGHFIIGEALFMGLKPAILEMRRLIDEARVMKDKTSRKHTALSKYVTPISAHPAAGQEFILDIELDTRRCGYERGLRMKLWNHTI